MFQNFLDPLQTRALGEQGCAHPQRVLNALQDGTATEIRDAPEDQGRTWHNDRGAGGKGGP